MKFNLKNYKLLKFKAFIKQKKFLIITFSIKQKPQIKKSQKFKALNCDYYQIHNTLTKKTFKSSIYKNYMYLIKSLITLLEPKNLDLKQLNKDLVIVGFKINNKIYLTHQLDQRSLQFNYKLNYITTTKTLKTALTSFKFSK